MHSSEVSLNALLVAGYADAAGHGAACIALHLLVIFLCTPSNRLQHRQAPAAAGRQVGAALKQSRAALAHFVELGGFARVTQLLLWTALAFAPAAGRSVAGGGAGVAPAAACGDGESAAGGEGGACDGAAQRWDGPASMSGPGKAPRPLSWSCP